MGGVISSFVLVGILLHVFSDLDWWYVCLIARIPIFMMGILFASIDLKRIRCCEIQVIIVLSLLMYYPLYNFSSKFFASSLLVIPIMIVAGLLKLWLGSKAMSFLVFLGKHSLQIYLANVLVMYTMIVLPFNIFIKPFYYVILQTVYTFMMVWFGQHVSIWLKTINKQRIKIS